MATNNKDTDRKKPVSKWGDCEHDTNVHKQLRPQKSTPTCDSKGTYLKDS